MAQQSAQKGASDGQFVAIDFGTCSSRLAYARGEAVGLLRDFGGETAVPSALAIAQQGGVLAAAGARERQMLYPHETLLALKTLLTATREDLASLGVYFPHAIDPAPGPIIQLDLGGRKRSALELAALFLAYLRRTAEIVREQPVRSAVIAVPIAMSPFDRQALRLAAQLAGFRRIRLVDDPIAAALAWAARGGRGRAAVCCWGAHYLSIAIVEADAEILRVGQMRGAAGSGGLSLDLALARDIQERMRAARGGAPPAHEAHMARWALVTAEKAKREICANGRFEVQLQTGGQTFHHAYRRADLDPWLGPLISQATDMCREIIESAGLRRGDFDVLVPAGGMLQITEAHDAIREVFGCRSFTDLELEEAVVHGAFARARFLDRAGAAPLAIDTLDMATGIEGQSGQVSAILERGVAIPASKVETFTTYLDQQTEVGVQLYSQQEAAWQPLAQVEIDKISPMKAGQPTLEVTFAVDEDGVLEAEAREVQRGRALGVELRPHRGLASRQVAAIAATIPAAAEEDLPAALLRAVRERAGFLLRSVRDGVRHYPTMMTRDERQLISKKLSEMDEVMEGTDLTEIRETLRELEEIAQPLRAKILDANLKSWLE